MRSSPSVRPERTRAVFPIDRPFAHRGLHGRGVPENSLAAFEAALAAGFGIECDVQASCDGIAFVFHDAHLDRLTEERGALANTSAEVLDRIRLKGDAECLPRFSAVLDLVAARVPLLVEIKAPGIQIARLCEAVLTDLAAYRGPVAIMSFNPLVAAWFSRRAPALHRGLVISEGDRRGTVARLKRALALCHAKPDFLAYDIRDLPSAFAARQRRRGVPVLTWTVRDRAQQETALTCADQRIFEIADDQE